MNEETHVKPCDRSGRRRHYSGQTLQEYMALVLRAEHSWDGVREQDCMGRREVRSMVGVRAVISLRLIGVALSATRLALHAASEKLK